MKIYTFFCSWKFSLIHGSDLILCGSCPLTAIILAVMQKKLLASEHMAFMMHLGTSKNVHEMMGLDSL